MMEQLAFGILEDALKREFYVGMDLMFVASIGIPKKGLFALDREILNSPLNYGIQILASAFLLCNISIFFEYLVFDWHHLNIF